MAKLYNLARVSCATVSTGTLTLGSAVSGYLTFALAGVANGDVVDYAIKDGANSEHGTGTYTSAGTTLTRTPTKSTNGNALINLSGASEVFISPRAETLNDASLFTTGSLADARLTSNVPLKNAANAFTNTNSFSSVATFSNNIVHNGGQLQSTTGATFFYATTNSGGYQFTTNFGSGASITAPSLTGAPFWFISSDAGTAGPAGYSLHRSGVYAVNVGMAIDNSWIIGGWSDGNQYRVRIDTGGNFVTRAGIWTAGVNPYTADGCGARNTAKAWVNFDGTSGTIRTQYNVSSVSRNAVGEYTINFANALPSANFTVAGATCVAQDGGTTSPNGTITISRAAGSLATTSCRINASALTGSAQDHVFVTAVIFGA